MFEWERSQLDDLHHILANVIISNECDDQWSWEGDSSGSFSVKLTYQALHINMVGFQSMSLMQNFWSLKVQQKALLLVWRIMLNGMINQNLIAFLCVVLGLLCAFMIQFVGKTHNLCLVLLGRRSRSIWRKRTKKTNQNMIKFDSDHSSWPWSTIRVVINFNIIKVVLIS